jgi:hypothetical protein
MKMKKSTIIALLTTTVITLSLLTPQLIQVKANGDPSSWYKTVLGNLDSDTYALYPFDQSNSLNIGFSQFGEMINTLDNVGLDYGDVDPFAPPAGSGVGQIPKVDWLQGWLINITYYHRILGQLRTVWASALHADAYAYGGNWIRVDFNNDWSITYGEEDPRDPGYIIGNYSAGSGNYGGRKTNGTASTAAIQVLYDGPRLYMARLVTNISDHPAYLSDSTTADVPLVQIRITILFEKVKKEVVLFKELKTLVSDKIADELKVQFSNRGEVDLGVEESGYDSYFHFYTEGQSRGTNWNATGKNYEANDTISEGFDTVYDSNWVLNQTENPYTSTWYNYSASGPYPQTSDATYDLAVAINPVINYTWYAAFWPSLSDWTIDGWDMWWRSMSATDPHDIDSRTWATPPRYESTIPFYIGEWDCVLKPKGKSTMQMYRFVTIYGVTDVHNADDADIEGRQSNTPDRETTYLLDEFFNPWDLQKAVDKTTRRWVQYYNATTYDYVTLTHRPVINVPYAYWDQYAEFSERVEDLTTGALLHRVDDDPLAGDSYEYTFGVDSSGYALIGDLTVGHYYKILYSTYPEVDTYRTKTVSIPLTTAYNKTSGQTITVSSRTLSDSWTDNIGVGHGFTTIFDAFTVYLTQPSAYNWTASWTMSTKQWNETDFKVFLGETYTSTYPGIADPTNVTATNATATCAWFEFGIDQLQKNVTAPTDSSVIWPLPKETVHVLSLNHTLDVTVSITNTNYTSRVEGLNNATQVITFTTTERADYNDLLMGRNEWGIVGRDADSVDSAGLSLVTAALKNKQVEFGLAGADIYASFDANNNAVNQMPWVFDKIGSGTSSANYYYYNYGGAYANDYRVALKDDWCTSWPISSSNMIGVGGPLANMLSYYGNDFTDAMFGLGQFTDYVPWEDQIVPRTCWNMADDTNTYVSTNSTGYGVISTYLDLNGTELFLIWGHWGRDTYYLTKWFHEYGVYQLQEAPAGVTSIIVKIDYTNYSGDYKPTAYSIVEVLGTISERLWIHNSEDKGGIHDP